MVEYKILNCKNIEFNKRLDPEYYKKDYILIDQIIANFDTTLLRYVARITDGDHDKRNYTSNGMLFLRSQDIFEYGIIIKEPVYISSETAKKLIRSTPENYDVLMTKTGNIGASVVFDKRYVPESNISADISLIRIINTKINPYFLVIYLNSGYGRKYVYRLMSGSGRPRVTLNNIKNLKIPILKESFQKKIEEISKFIYKYNYESLSLINNKLKDINSSYSQLLNTSRIIYHIDSVSSVTINHRMDAEFYNIFYVNILNKIKEAKYSFIKLLDCASLIGLDFDSSKHPNTYFNYIELSDIDQNLGIITNSTKLLGKELPSRAKRILKENDIIISSVEGSLDKVAIVDKLNDGAIASNGFIQLRSTGIKPEVLLLLAKSIILQSQLRRYSTGTILTSVNSNAVKNFIIPVLYEGKQDSLSSDVKKSHELRRKAINLLELAKGAVEIAIEENEDKAIEYLKENLQNSGDFNGKALFS